MFTPLTGRRRQLASAAAIVIASGIASVPTRIASQDQPRPTFRTEANYVRVDVYATTKDGVPIEDLRRDEFELLEDRVPQTIDQFATVRIRGGGPPTARSDPRTPEESRQAAADARARVFILFLDVMHVDRTASIRIATPLTDALRNLLGPDDLLAVVMPGLSVRALTLTRQIAIIESALNNPWGGRDTVALDPVERRYADCYPGIPKQAGQIAADRGIAQEMILRRREAQTLDSLDSLVTYLRDAREERKAVITITNGWRLYRPNDSLRRAIRDTVPSVPQVTIDPRTGRLTTEPTGGTPQASACDTDRLRLASLDHDSRFRQILDQANRANVSFYPIDPRGVVAFDDDIFPAAGVGQNPVLRPEQERARLAERSTSLHVMAEQTDGVAVTATNDLALGLRRMTADLSAYYLLGYYSTGKLDGRFHAITVRATRPGVQIRARRGYLAASSAAPPAPLESSGAAAGAAQAQAVSSALASLNILTRDRPLRLHAAVGPASASSRTITAIVEIGRTVHAAWGKGGEADASLIDASGATVASSRLSILPASLSVQWAVGPRPLPPGDYELRVRAKPASPGSTATDSLRVTVPATADGAGFLMFKRGPGTGNRELATADLRFRRSDTLRLVVPASDSSESSARLLDRTGKVLQVPIPTATRDEADGSKSHSATLALAPLATGDYLIELIASQSTGPARTLIAFRVVP
jgi:VWFA-related protein